MSMIEVEVTADDIATGEAGDCFRCAAALALARATGDDHANVYERDWGMWLEARGRSIMAPHEVRKFVWDFDERPRADGGRLDAGHEDYAPPAPFRFTLPDQSDPAWQEQCCHCEELFEPADLDDEGVCVDCRTREEDAKP